MAEETQNTQNTEPTEQESKPADSAAEEKKFSQKELDDILNKRLERERKNQPTKDELTAFRSWKESQKTEEQKQSEQARQLETANGRIAQLEAEIKSSKLNAAVLSCAAKLGIEPTAGVYIGKLADLSDALNESGEPDEGKITAAVNKVLEDVPALKMQKSTNTGFRTVGSDGNSSPNRQTEDDRLRKAFGLKPKN